MTARQVDSLLDDRARLIAQKASLQGHLWASEFLLHRVGKLLPHLIADNAHNAVALETLGEEIRELLAEDREHPGLPDGGAVYGEEDVPPPSGSGVDHVDI